MAKCPPRGMLGNIAGVGLPPDGKMRTPEQALWHAVLIQGLKDARDGVHFDKEDFEIICAAADVDADYVLRKFREANPQL